MLSTQTHVNSTNLIADIRKSLTFTNYGAGSSERENPHLHAPAYPFFLLIFFTKILLNLFNFYYFILFFTKFI